MFTTHFGHGSAQLVTILVLLGLIVLLARIGRSRLRAMPPEAGHSDEASWFMFPLLIILVLIGWFIWSHTDPAKSPTPPSSTTVSTVITPTTEPR